MNREIPQKRGCELLGVSLKVIKRRCRKLREKQGIQAINRQQDVVSKPTPGGPVTERRIAGMEIVKYGDYVIYGRTSTDFWKETSVDIIIHVRKTFFRHALTNTNRTSRLASMVQISKMLQICIPILNDLYAYLECVLIRICTHHLCLDL